MMLVGLLSLEPDDIFRICDAQHTLPISRSSFRGSRLSGLGFCFIWFKCFCTVIWTLIVFTFLFLVIVDLLGPGLCTQTRTRSIQRLTFLLYKPSSRIHSSSQHPSHVPLDSNHQGETDSPEFHAGEHEWDFRRTDEFPPPQYSMARVCNSL